MASKEVLIALCTSTAAVGALYAARWATALSARAAAAEAALQAAQVRCGGIWQPDGKPCAAIALPRALGQPAKARCGARSCCICRGVPPSMVGAAGAARPVAPPPPLLRAIPSGGAAA
jgi:hypothetical protein